WIQGYSRRLLNENGDYGPEVATGYGTGYSQWPVAHTTKYVGIGLKGDFKLGNWKNDYVLSVDRMWFERRTIGTYGTDPAEHYISAPGNIYHTNTTPWASFPKKSLRTQYAFKSLGWHIVDTITAPGDKLDITLGLHGHRVDRAQNYSGGNEIDAHATCPTYAVTYRFTPKFMVYGNHSESFAEGSVVGSGYANMGETIPPAKTKQNEIGFKYQNAGMVQTRSL
ncbi:MAG: TonB-dependent receptor, partial [Acidaminococcaceae bacterium]|nr:TonB-dependent receptor [Acidaminococcaceae bacterium]